MMNKYKYISLLLKLNLNSNKIRPINNWTIYLIIIIYKKNPIFCDDIVL